MKKIVLLFSFFLVTQLINAQQLAVPGEYSTIQAAIDAAVDGDTVLVEEDTYTENINFLGKAITVGSRYLIDLDTSHISKTIIDGSGATNLDTASVVTMWSGEDTTSVLTGFTIKGGNGTIAISGAHTRRSGGGVLILYSGGKITHNIIMENHFQNAIYGYYGCGLYAYVTDAHTAIIRDNIVRNNTGTGMDGWGAGVHIFGGNVLFEGNTVRNNSMTNSSFSFGAGVLCYLDQNYMAAENAFVFRNNHIAENQANSANLDLAAGGGLTIFHKFKSGKVRIYNNIISSNTTTGWGGGLYTYFSQPIIYNNTIIDNKADVTGNSLLLERWNIWVFYNNIVWSEPGNDKSDIAYFDYYGRVNAFNNILMDSYADDDQIVGLDNIFLKPIFKEDSFHLDSQSPGVDDGVDSVEIIGSLFLAPTKDYYDFTRLVSSNTLVDIGAIEDNDLYFKEINVIKGAECNVTIEVIVEGGTPPFTFYKNSIENEGNIFTDLCSDDYTFSVEDCNGVTIETTLNVTGLEKSIAESDLLSIYPNPTNSLLTIETKQPDHHLIEIVSLSGQSIYRTEMEGNIKQIDLTPFRSGIYFLTVRSKEFVQTEKIVKL